MPKTECSCCEGKGFHEWRWEQAFRDGGFPDAEKMEAMTPEVVRILEEPGYTVYTEWGFISPWINSIELGTKELIDWEKARATDFSNPREFLPKEIVSRLDRKFPA